MSLVFPACAVAFFSIMALWRPNAPLFMVAGGAAMVTGLKWFDVFTTDDGLAISLVLIVYSFICLAFAFKFIFWRGDIVRD